MTKDLPARPSIEFLKNEAKSLLRAARDGDPLALSRFPTDPSKTLQLADAQRVVAAEYGFASWVHLKQHVEDILTSAKSREEQISLVIRCCIDGEVARAERILRRHPDLATADIYIAATVGEIATVLAKLDADPSLMNSLGGPLNTSPLVYACSSRFASPTDPREPQIRSIVRELLKRRADANGFWRNPKFNDCPLSALYGACGANGNIELTRLLLEAGANPNDNESLYHSVEHPGTACTQLLLDHGARIPGTNAAHNAVALGNVEAIKLILLRGADPNMKLGNHPWHSLFHWAIECHQSRQMLEVLIEYGADIRTASADGLTPFRRAIHFGNVAAIDLLRTHGVAEPLTEAEELLAACTTGDEQWVRELKGTRPDLVNEFVRNSSGLLYGAAWRGSTAAVRTMLAIGFDVSCCNERRATALHAAAWKGHTDLVKMLVALGAPLDVKENEFNCTPLEWALHGSYYCRPVSSVETTAALGEEYATIVEVLLQAGSPRPNDRMVRLSTSAVQEVLEAAGITVDGDS